MEHAGKLLSRDLIHVRDHQQQALGGRVGGGQSAGTQRAVDSTGRTGLRLHFHDLDGGAEDVLQSGRRPLVNKVGHGRRRRNGVDAGDFGKRIGYVRRGIVAVHRFELTSQFQLPPNSNYIIVPHNHNTLFCQSK